MSRKDIPDQKGDVTIATREQWSGDNGHISLGYARDKDLDVSVCIHGDDLFIEVHTREAGGVYNGFVVPMQALVNRYSEK